MTHQNKLNRH